MLSKQCICFFLEQEMLQKRSSLPIAELKDEILLLLEKNNVVVISGETGCGKTTQVGWPFHLTFQTWFGSLHYFIALISFLTLIRYTFLFFVMIMQVPQYILDHMIEAGRGGLCNVICTQPRRIAVCSWLTYVILIMLRIAFLNSVVL